MTDGEAFNEGGGRCLGPADLEHPTVVELISAPPPSVGDGLASAQREVLPYGRLRLDYGLIS